MAAPHVNRYGGTLSVMFRRSLFLSEIGLLVSGGPITVQSVDVLGGSLAPVRARGMDWQMMVTYSSSLRE